MRKNLCVVSLTKATRRSEEQQLEEKNVLFLIAQNVARGLHYVSEKTRKLVNAYRYVAADRKFGATMERPEQPPPEQLMATELEELRDELQPMNEEQQYLADTMSALLVLDPDEDGLMVEGEPSGGEDLNQVSADWIRSNGEQTKQAAADLEKSDVPRPLVDNINPYCPTALGGPSEGRAKFTPIDPPDFLTGDQKKAWVKVNHLVEDGAAAVLLIHGSPGTGKSVLANALVGALGQLMAAFGSTGVAATQVSGAVTIHRGLNINAFATLKDSLELDPNTLKDLQDRYVNTRVLLFDEVSMISELWLQQADHRLRQIFGKPDVAFGGKIVLLCGDFFQLPPVGPAALYKVNSPLLADLNFVALNEQKRSLDPEHTKNIQDLRDPEKAAAALKRLVRGTKVLDEQDDAELWEEAPVVVSSNKERHAINLQRAKMWAKRRKTCVIAIPRGKNKVTEQNVASDDCLLFVPNAPGILEGNINPAIGLANGTTCRFVEANFVGIQAHFVKEQMKQTRPGGVLILSFSPKTLTVEITTRNDEKKKVPVFFDKCQCAFSFTFHKVQGVTIPRIIVQLNKRPNSLGQLPFQAFYVAMSRVKRGNDIRLLPPRGVDGLSHLFRSASFKPDTHLIKFLDKLAHT